MKNPVVTFFLGVVAGIVAVKLFENLTEEGAYKNQPPGSNDYANSIKGIKQ